MDTLEENEIAPAVYALCNAVHYHGGQAYWEQAWKDLETPLNEALQRAMQALFE